jgi:hypothetical protein
MVNETDPPPLPDAPLPTVIHEAFDTAVQAQPAAVVTVVEPLPPLASTDCADGEIE